MISDAAGDRVSVSVIMQAFVPHFPVASMSPTASEYLPGDARDPFFFKIANLLELLHGNPDSCTFILTYSETIRPRTTVAKESPWALLTGMS